MIELINVENRVRLELAIEEYQFPDVLDDNWYMVRCFVKHEEHSFEVYDPALETSDVQSMLAWFRCLANRQLPSFAKLSFTEPCLEFEFLSCRNNLVRIAINLNHELKPNFSLNQFEFSRSDWCVVFELNAREFEKIISGMESAIARYPARNVSVSS
jgi:hypothetical protein